MRYYSLLFAFIFLVHSKADERVIGRTHVTQGSQRTFKTAKEGKIAQLELDIARAEVGESELDLELKKLEKLGEGSRDKKRIDADKAQNAKRLKEKRGELEITKTLFESSCRAKLFVYERGVNVYDRDSGLQTGVVPRHFIGCVSIADTCGKNEKAQALITSFGDDVQEEQISKSTDPREGKECHCNCVRW